MNVFFPLANFEEGMWSDPIWYRVGKTEFVLIRICICSIRAFHTLLITNGVKKKIPIVPYHTVLRDTIIAQSIGPNWVSHSYLFWRCSPHLERCGKIRPFMYCHGLSIIIWLLEIDFLNFTFKLRITEENETFVVPK